jgi:hypothetical protein
MIEIQAEMMPYPAVCVSQREVLKALLYNGFAKSYRRGGQERVIAW